MISKKIKSPKALKKILSELRRKKCRTVFTNGCFDLLHSGHVTCLEKAKKLGTHLIVALNSDRSVRRLKGPSRPVNVLKARMTVIAALESVDFVTSFSEGTPLQTILKLKPDVLVKGGDYKLNDIVGAHRVKRWGGKVVVIPLVKGFSTSSLLKQIGN